MGSLPAWIALAHAAGIVLGDALAPETGALRVAAWALAGPGLLVLRRPVPRAALAIALAGLAGAASIAARLELAATRPPEAARRVVLDGRVCGASPFGGRAAGVVLCDPIGIDLPWAPRGAATWPGRVLVSTPRHGDGAGALARARDGERLRVSVRTREPTGPRNPGARDDRLRLARRGIGARAYLVDPASMALVEDGGGGWVPHTEHGSRLDAWRSGTARRLGAIGPGGALLAALALGERGGLSDAQRAAFGELGIAHLLAVSGLHVALVLGLALATLRLTCTALLDGWGLRDPRVACALLAWWVALAYAVGAGLGVPLQRALTVAGGWVLAFAAGRRWPPAHGLAVAGLLVMSIDPAMVFDPGAQLSFAAVAALVGAPAYAGVRDAAGDATPRGVAGAVASARTSALALAGTAPVLATHGMALGAWGLVVNVVAVPLTGLVLLPTALLAAGLAAFGPGPGVERALVVCAWPAARAIEAVSGLAAALPPSPPLAPAAPAVVAVGGLVAVAAVRARSEVRRTALVLAGVLWLRGVGPPAVWPAPPRLVAFDVGQGDAILIEGRRGRMLVDGGRAIPGRSDAGGRVVVPALAALGVASLDVVVASHADLDHRGGLEAVLRSVPVAALWVPAGGLDEPALASIVALARTRDVRVEEIGRGSRPRDVGDLRVEPLWPPTEATSAASNDRSIVARVRVEGDAVLLTGDASRDVEAELLARPAAVRARVLKVAHHGSRSSSSARFLDAVAPALAIVPAACGASSGLPTRAVLDRLEAVATEVLWTGRDGAVLVPLGARRSDRAPRAWAPRRRCGTPSG